MTQYCASGRSGAPCSRSKRNQNGHSTAKEWYEIYLHFVVISLQFTTQLLQFLLQADRFAKLRSIGISFFLESISTFFVLLIVLFESSHIRKEFARPFCQVVNLLHVVHLRNLLHEVSIGALYFTF
jgi:hypothetical protein